MIEFILKISSYQAPSTQRMIMNIFKFKLNLIFRAALNANVAFTASKIMIRIQRKAIIYSTDPFFSPLNTQSVTNNTGNLLYFQSQYNGKNDLYFDTKLDSDYFNISTLSNLFIINA